MKLNLIFTGVGGQGIIAASDVFCEAALFDGFDVTKTELRGMAQRGGSVIAHVRIGDHILNPIIERGTSDIILGFEILESVRSLPLLKDKGTVVLNKQLIPPVPVIQGLAECPDIDEIMDRLRDKAKQVYEIDGVNLASMTGNIRSMNIVLLGALSAILENQVKEESLLKAISQTFQPRYRDINLNAFQLGRKSV